MKKKGGGASLQERLFSISNSCLYLVSMETHQCYVACLTYLSGCPPKSGPASLGSPVNLPFSFCGSKGLNEE